MDIDDSLSFVLNRVPKTLNPNQADRLFNILECYDCKSPEAMDLALRVQEFYNEELKDNKTMFDKIYPKFPELRPGLISYVYAYQALLMHRIKKLEEKYAVINIDNNFIFFFTTAGEK